MRNPSQTLCVLFCLAALAGCASSDVSRSAASNVDNVYNSSQNVTKTSDPVGAFTTATQAVKGGVIGGVAGAAIGTATSGIGTLPGALGGIVFGAAMGAYVEKHTNSEDRLINSGVQVVELGDSVKVILDSSALFHSMTPVLNTSAYKTLDQVAAYLKSFPKLSVRIAAYTNGVGSTRINQEISNEQANAVARYLWSQGVGTRLLTSQGYGGTRPVTQDSSDWADSANYRVEITAEKA